MQPKLSAGHKHLAERIPILGWFKITGNTPWPAWARCTRTYRIRMQENVFSSTSSFARFLQNVSINQLYLSTGVIKAEKLMGPSQKKKYKTTRILLSYIVQ